MLFLKPIPYSLGHVLGEILSKSRALWLVPPNTQPEQCGVGVAMGKSFFLFAKHSCSGDQTLLEEAKDQDGERKDVSQFPCGVH